MYILNNFLTYESTGRISYGSTVKNSQRDETFMLTEFEKKAFRMSSGVLFNANHTFCTLDDDLFETRASRIIVRCCIQRMVDLRGHTTIYSAVALFRVMLSLWFKHRAENQGNNCSKVVHTGD